MEDVIPALEQETNNKCDNGSDSDEFQDDEEDEMSSNDEEPTICLFCDKVCLSVATAIDHVNVVHNVNFRLLKSKFQMDQYSFLKLINCIRSEDVKPDKIVTSKTPFWNDEKYLKHKQYEPWLTYDYDEMIIPLDDGNSTSNEDRKLHSLIEKLQLQVKMQALMLEQANEDMAKMRTSFQRIVEKESVPTTLSTLEGVAGTSTKSDEGYFSSYSHFGIHHEMLSDSVRTTSYRNALLKNKDYVQGKDVLDVGCGTGILSIFASQAKARTVVGIDNSDVIYNAMDIVKKNNVDNVTLIKGRLENTELPQEKFDIIISEWMGYFLLFEGMLDSIIYARDNHLKVGGILMPNRCTMSLLGYGSDALYRKHVSFWNEVYGLDMSTMRKEVMHEPLIDIVAPEDIITEPNLIADLNLSTVDMNYSNFSNDFNLKCSKDGDLSAIVGYFDTYFDLQTHPVMFGTAPTDHPTHWKQVVFFLEQPRPIKAADIVSGKLTCRRSRNSVRSLDITIEIFGRKHTYYLD